MTVSSRIRDLFGRAKSSPALSTSVVQHQRIDDLVLDDLRADSKSFDAMLIDRPTLQLGEDENGQAIEKTYDLAPPLYSDLFHAHYTQGDEVKLTPGDEVKASHDLNRRVMEAFVNHDEFRKTRSLTRNDELTAALSTRAAKAVLDEELGSTLKAHAERAAEMDEREQQMAEQEDALRELRERAAREKREGGAVSDQVRDAIQDAARQKADARQSLQDLIQQQDNANVGYDVQQAVDQAAKDAQDTASSWASIPGSCVGDKSRMSPDQAFELATKWKDNHQLAEVAKLVGRFERDFRFQRSNRIQGGRDEVVDVELGNDLAVVLPTELMKLADPILRMKFFRQYTNKSLLQYETVGNAEAGNGPIIPCIDRSGSMGFDRSVFANAITLAMLSIARREKRDFASIDFMTTADEPVFFPKRGAIDTDAVTQIAMGAGSGGTDITAALRRAREVINTVPAFKSADIIIITDGADGWVEDDIEIANEFAARGIRIHAMVIGCGETFYTNEAARLTGGTAVSIEDLKAPSDATSTLAGAIS
jgi:uncharacterized protein with von Willebrand factor type A (vWA) domain